MEWSQVDSIWKTCFELAWESHLEGSNPIAAVVVNAAGEIVSAGKSAVKASVSGVEASNCEIAHAEVNALLALDNREHHKARAGDYRLYVTLEPCPLCFSAFYMSDVKSLVYAARDRFAGSTNLLGTTPYMSRKTRAIEGPVVGLEGVSIFLNVYCNVLRGTTLPDAVHDAMRMDFPQVVQKAEDLAVDDGLDVASEQQFSLVYAKMVAAIDAV